MDKEEQIVTFFRNIGVQTQDLFQYNIHTRQNDARGYQEIIDYCLEIAKKSNDYYEIHHSVFQEAQAVKTRDKALIFLEYFFLNIIKSNLSSTMPITTTESEVVKLIHINSFCELENDDDNKMCEKVLNNMMTVIQENSQNNNNGPVIVGETRMKLFENLHLLELCKVNTISRLVQQILSNHPNAKVVVAINKRNTITKLKELLEPFQPKILSGSINLKLRAQVIEEFQQPNLNSRLIIANIKVVSSGIDLDDKDGRFPRYVFINNAFDAMMASQFVYRFLRNTDTKSNTIIRNIYTLRGLQKYYNVDDNIVNQSDVPFVLNKNEINSNYKCSYYNLQKVQQPQQRPTDENIEFNILHILTKKSSFMKKVSSETEILDLNTFDCEIIKKHHQLLK
jgi:hypothetical protein